RWSSMPLTPTPERSVHLRQNPSPRMATIANAPSDLSSHQRRLSGSGPYETNPDNQCRGSASMAKQAWETGIRMMARCDEIKNPIRSFRRPCTRMTDMSTNNPMILCPKCATKIRLTDSLTEPILAAMRKEYEDKLVDQQRLFEDREKGLVDQEREIDRRKAALDDEIRDRLRSEREQIAQEEAQKAKVAFNNQLQSGNEENAELRRVLAERDKKLAEARKVEAEIRRKERQLEEARLEMECTVESRINESLTEIRAKALKDAEGRLKLRIIEKEETIAGMKRQIEDLKRKAEQGSQQLQGDAQEIELEKLLRSKFPGDIIKRIPKGTSGGD